MEAKEIKNMHNGRSLGESMDLLREHVEELAWNVSELYDLDDDNFKKIHELRNNLGSIKTQLDGLSMRVRRNRGKMVLGFFGLGGLVWLGSKTIDNLSQRVKALEEQKTEKDPEKAEESDG